MRMMFLMLVGLVAVLIVFGTLMGCSPTIMTHGIPNFAQVKPGLWRGGQPTSSESWAYLQSLGVKHVVKLNMDSEGDDYAAMLYGMELHALGIQPEGDKDIFDNISNTFVRPDPVRIQTALDLIRAGGGVFAHCVHGQDRTGLVIAESRVLQDGWTKSQARVEMLRYGYHPLLHGLEETWEDFQK